MNAKSETVNRIMFDYEDMSLETVSELASGLSMKLCRWVAVNHPDNRIRHHLFRRTNVSIGKESVVNYNVLILDCYRKLVTIGNRVAIASNVTIICVSDPNNSCLKEDAYVQEKLIQEGPVTIRDDVWIGANVVILPNVVIGERAIIGAGSVVAANVPSDTVCAGTPCRVIRGLSKEISRNESQPRN